MLPVVEENACSSNVAMLLRRSYVSVECSLVLRKGWRVSPGTIVIVCGEKQDLHKRNLFCGILPFFV